MKNPFKSLIDLLSNKPNETPSETPVTREALLAEFNEEFKNCACPVCLLKRPENSDRDDLKTICRDIPNGAHILGVNLIYRMERDDPDSATAGILSIYSLPHCVGINIKCGQDEKSMQDKLDGLAENLGNVAKIAASMGLSPKAIREVMRTACEKLDELANSSIVSNTTHTKEVLKAAVEAAHRDGKSLADNIKTVNAGEWVAPKDGTKIRLSDLIPKNHNLLAVYAVGKNFVSEVSEETGSHTLPEPEIGLVAIFQSDKGDLYGCVAAGDDNKDHHTRLEDCAKHCIADYIEKAVSDNQ